MDTNMQLNLPLHLEYQSLNVNSGLDKGMAAKRHHILAKCYDRKGRLLSAAFNSYTKTHPLQSYFARKVGHPERQFLHAEIAAILKARGKPIHRITVERYNAKGLPANACPCPVCRSAIRAFSIQVVEYTK